MLVDQSVVLVDLVYHQSTRTLERCELGILETCRYGRNAKLSCCTLDLDLILKGLSLESHHSVHFRALNLFGENGIE